jgi:hypothetical protein
MSFVLHIQRILRSNPGWQIGKLALTFRFVHHRDYSRLSVRTLSFPRYTITSAVNKPAITSTSSLHEFLIKIAFNQTATTAFWFFSRTARRSIPRPTVRARMDIQFT